MSTLAAGIRLALALLGALGLGAPASTPTTGTPVAGAESRPAGKQVVARPTATNTKARKWALIIGVGEYTDRRIPGISFCRKDATDLAAALRGQHYEVVCITDEGEKSVVPRKLEKGEQGGQSAGGTALEEKPGAMPVPAPQAPDAVPTRENILKRVEAFLKDEHIREGDMLLAYFSGHGFATEDTAYLATRDAKVDDLETTCIPVTWLRDRLQACHATQKVLVLDSCHSGVPPKFKGAKVAPEQPKLPGQHDAAARIFAAASAARGMVTMASCRGDESSWQKGDNSAFTAFVLKGMQQDADGNRDGQVGVMELHKYVHDQVTAYAKDMGVQQTPVFQSPGIEGDITLVTCAIPKGKSNPFLYVGGAGALGLIAAVAGGGGGGSQPPAVTTANVSGYVFRTKPTYRGVVQRVREFLTRQETQGRLLLRSSSTQPEGSEPAQGASVSSSSGASDIARADGAFLLTVPQGQAVTITAQQEGYTAASTEITASSGSPISVPPVGDDPQADLAPPGIASAVAQDSFKVLVTFDEIVTRETAEAAANYRLDNGLDVVGAALQSSTSVLLTTTQQTGDATYTVTVSGVKDRAGNASQAAKSFQGKDTVSPRLTDAKASGSTKLLLTFSEPVEPSTVTVAAFVLSGGLAPSVPQVQDGNKVLLTTTPQVYKTQYTVKALDVKDRFDNTVDGTANEKGFDGDDDTPPAVAGAVGVPDSRHVAIVFNEAVDEASLAAAGFVIPGLTVSVAGLSGDLRTVSLNTSEQRQGKGYQLSITGVKDLKGNVYAGSTPVAFTGKGVPPSIAGGSVEWVQNGTDYVYLNFDEPLDPNTLASATFTIVTAGGAGLSVGAADIQTGNTSIRLTTAEQCQGRNYTATVTGVADVVGNAVGTANTWDFVGKGVAPLLNSAGTWRDATHVDLFFSEALDSTSAQTPANYVVNGGATAVSAVLDGSTVHLEIAEQTTGAAYNVRVKNVADLGGNAIADDDRNVATFTGQGVAPQVAGAVAASADGTGVEVTFSEAVEKASAEGAANYTFTSGEAAFSATQAAQTGPSTVLLTTPEHVNGAQYQVAVRKVKDLAGNAIGDTDNTFSYTGVGVPPQVDSAAPVDSLTVDLLFNEALDPATANVAGNYALAPGTGGVAVGVSKAELQSDLRTVRLTTGEHTNGAGYTVTASNATDAAGNPIGSTANSAGYTGIGVPPQVRAAAAVDGNTVEITFSEPVDQATAEFAGNYTLTPGTGGASVTVTGATRQADPSKVWLTTSDHTGSVQYSVAVANVTDIQNNPIDPSNNTKSYTAKAPTFAVAGASAPDATHVDVVFSKAFDPASASNPANYAISTGLSATAVQQVDGKSVRLTTGQQVGGAGYILTVTGVQDAFGNAVPAGSNSAQFTGNAPQVASAAAADSTHVNVVFDRTMDAGTANTPGSYAISAGAGAASISASDAKLQGDNRTVLLTTTEQTGGKSYTITVTGVQDSAGNLIGPGNNGTSFTGIGTPLRVLSARAVDSTTVEVTFSELVDQATGETAVNYTVTPDTGGASVTVQKAAKQSDATKVLLQTTEHTASIQYTVAVADVRDTQLNGLDATNSATYTADGLPPQVAGVTAVDPQHVDVLFSEALESGSVGAGTYTITPSLAASAPTLQGDGKTVRLTTDWQVAGTSYSLTVSGVKDQAWNPVGSTNNPATFKGYDNVSVSGDSVTQTGGAAGGNLGLYQYRVTYTQKDNKAPSYLRLTITRPDSASMGTFDMAKDPTDSTYSDGCAYTFQPSILLGGTGTYAYTIQASDGTIVASAVTGNGPQVTSLDPGRIAFVSGSQIDAMSPDGSVQAALTNDGATNTSPSWASDGCRVLFSTNRDGGAPQIYAMDPDGNNATRLTNSAGSSDQAAVWSPDGTRVAFSRNGVLYLMDAEGTNVAALPGPGGGTGSYPVWSPDGSKIAFQRTTGATNDVYVVKPDGTGLQQLTAGSGSNECPSWSPDGTKIACQSNRDGNYEIYVMNATGTGQTRLTNNGASDQKPVWSPDGTRIAFSTTRDGNSQVYVMNADGSAPVRVTSNAVQDTAPAWIGGTQPVPRTAAFASDKTVLQANGTATATITATVRDGAHRLLPNAAVGFGTTLGSVSPASAATNASGQATATLTASSTPGTAVVTADVSGGWHPTLSASVLMDASRILFSESSGGYGRDIYVMNGDGTGRVQLTNSGDYDDSPSPSPDGTRIAFASARDGKSQIYVMNVDGSAQANLSNNTTNEWAPAWSPDGSRIAFVSSYQICVMNADGTGRTNLSAYSSDLDRDPVWSPDGSKIAFVSTRTGYYQIYVMNADGTGQTQLTAIDGTSPSWSPDGTKIAFESFRNAGGQIYVMNADGTAQTRLTNNGGNSNVFDEHPAWAPEGKRITFTSNRGNGFYEIYIMDADGTGQTKVTSDNGRIWDPVWSSTLQAPSAYTATAAADPGIILADASTTSTITVTVRDGGYRLLQGATVDFSATAGTLSASSAATDAAGRAVVTIKSAAAGVAVVSATAGGRMNPVAKATVTLVGQGQIAFQTTRDSNRGMFEAAYNQIYVMNADGTAQTRLTENSADDQHPAWSPDCQKIAFDSNRDGNTEVYVMKADGSEQANLSNNGAADADPCWSPDGQKIAYVSQRDGNREIYVMNSDGTGQINLTNHSADDMDPAWSPDGTKIAFRSIRDGNWEIYAMKTDGTGQTNLTNNSAWDESPAWSPDGTEIAFDSRRDGNIEIYVMKADGALPRRMTINSAWDAYPSWSPDGSKIAFESDRSVTVQVYVMDADGTGQTRITDRWDEWPAWSSGLGAAGKAPKPRARAAALRAVCDGETASARLTATGIEPIESAGRAAGLRFVPAMTDRARTPGLPASATGRSWEFSLEGAAPGSDITLSWPDLSSLGSKDRVVLEDLDANVRRSMRTSANYTFRGESRRFRVTAEPRTGASVLITGLEMAPTRGGTRVVRFNLSADATVDVELLSPAGPVVAAVARQRAAVAGTNQVSWRGEVSPGIYLLRATATTEDGTSVQAVRPVVVTR